jgi:hypothetical protein
MQHLEPILGAGFVAFFETTSDLEQLEGEFLLVGLGMEGLFAVGRENHAHATLPTFLRSLIRLGNHRFHEAEFNGIFGPV